MIPRAQVKVDPRLPAAATYWVPRPAEVTDEGFGYFRNVWPMVDVPVTFARQVIQAERLAVEYIDAHASSVDDFNLLAEAADIGNEYEDGEVSPWPDFPPDEASPWPGLSGLDLGVAGLVHALSSTRFYPAASSRGGEAWANNPVVFVAMDEPRAHLLQPLVDQAGCGFSIDGARPDLLVIEAPSILEVMELADRVMSNGPAFRKLPKTNRRQGTPHSKRVPRPTLF